MFPLHWILLPVVFVSINAARAVPPKITGVSSYRAKAGDSVTIYGADFAPAFADNIVTFGAVKGIVLSGSATELQVCVPFGATSAPISVNVPGQGIAASRGIFVQRSASATDITNRSFGRDQYASRSFPFVEKPASVLLSRGSASTCLIHDVDGDGKSDLIVGSASGVAIYRNIHSQGDLSNDSFAPPVTLPVIRNVVSLSCGDMNGDGRDDLVIGASYQGAIFVHQNNSIPGQISFSSAIQIAAQSFASIETSVKIVDADGDGLLDVVYLSTILQIVKNKGVAGQKLTSNTFGTPVQLLLGGTCLGVGDFVGDSKPDFVVASGSKLTILENKSSAGVLNASSFSSSASLETTSAVSDLSIADFNSDGLPEIVAVTQDRISIFSKTDPGSVNAGTFTKIDGWVYSKSGWSRVLAEDLNGDGQPELLLRAGSNCVVGLNDGGNLQTFPFPSAVLLDKDAYPDFLTRPKTRIAVGDLNLDGLPDLVFSEDLYGVSVSQNFSKPLVHDSYVINAYNSSYPWFRAASCRSYEVMSDGGGRDITLNSVWQSSAPEVAKLTSGGILLSYKVGTTTMTATFAGHDFSKTVTVSPVLFGIKPGEPDGRFLPMIANGGALGVVNDFALLPDGKVLIAGLFSSANQFGVRNLVRLNADGSTDSTFKPGASPDGEVSGICVDNEGRILIVGQFETYNRVARKAVARLMPDGSLDASFDAQVNASSGTVSTCAIRSNGQILIGGDSLKLGSETVGRPVVQLLSDGTRDSSFSTEPSQYETINSLKPLPDGGLLVGGYSLKFGGADAFSVRKLRENGQIDSSFKLGISAGTVNQLAIQADGKILAGGALQTAFGQAIKDIVRLNPDGSLDDGFSAPVDTEVRAFALQANGKIIVGNVFDEHRLNSDGSLDTTWAPTIDVEWSPKKIKVAGDEKIWICGGNSTRNAYPVMGIARLHGDVTTYLGWQTKYFTQPEVANEEIANPDFVKAGADVTNLYRYAAGLAPDSTTVEDTFPRVDPIGEGSDGVFTYRRPIGSSDLLDEVGVSRDLVTWDFSGDHIVRVGTPVTNSDGVTETVKFRYLPPDGNDTAAFFKLRLSLRP